MARARKRETWLMALTALALAGVIAMTVVGATRGSAPAVASDPTKEPVAQPQASATPTEASATEEAEAAAATITVSNGGAVTWSFTVPAGSTFSYSEVRWRTTGTEPLDDWSGKKNQVFYSAGVRSYQIPNLLPGTRYKAKVFVAVTSGGKTQYLKSPTIRFANPDMTVTNTGLVTWSFEVPAGATFSYSEVRWRTTGTEPLDDWSGKLNKVFWSASANSYQIPDLVAGQRYKAKVFVEVTSGGPTQYLKSQTIRFLEPAPTPTPTPTPLPTPELITIATGEAGVIVLEWADGPANATGWQYRQRLTKRGTWGAWTDVPNSTGTTKSYRITGLQIYRAYYFQVRAKVDTGYSPTSSAVRGATHDFEQGVPRLIERQLVEGDGRTWLLGGNIEIAIPAGVRLMACGGALTSAGYFVIALCHPETGSSISFDVETGESGREVVKPEGASGADAVDMDTVFDQILNSMTLRGNTR